MRTINSLKCHRYGTYDDLASEYYDCARHPTCANFREASQSLLIPWLREMAQPEGHILEIGAGCSIVSEWLAKDKRSVARSILADLSLKMLRYSQVYDCSSH